MNHVTKRFGARAVLPGVSLELAAGDYVAILGESGIGKSTLLNAIAGLEPVDGGTITFDGRDINGMDDDALTLLRREQFGFVFQAFHVLPHLALEANVGLPLVLRGVDEAETARRAREALAAVGLAGREGSMPRELSGGELQRVAIARALVGRPRLVLADEPTGNLDERTGDAVVELLLNLCRETGTALVLVTHNAAHAAKTNRGLFLHEGVLR